MRPLLLLALLLARAGLAQPLPDAGPPPASPTDPMPMDPAMPGMDPGGAMLDPLVLGMSREGSGTAWQPDSTPVLGVHFMPGAGWMLMLHWNLFVGYDAQTTPRGGHSFTSMNWVMAMAEHALLGGQFMARVMLSAEPFTTGGKAGYPLLLQTGEEVDGIALHDRQHPHDLFMEVAIQYDHALTEWLALEFYGALSGEPALGPVAFPHRASALPNPFAALGHHWQDSTHVSFGVLTAGLSTRDWKLEGSLFNGREPDDDRYDFDLGSLDSWSTRLSFNPGPDWSFQISYGHLAAPEEQAPGVSVDRLTASAMFNHPLADGNWATTLVFGKNWVTHAPSTQSGLLESSLEFGANTLFGRLEVFQRTASDLLLEGPPVPPGQVFTSAVLELGYVRRLATLGPVNFGLGALGSVYALPGGLQPFYGGSAFPVAGMIFLRLWPTELRAR